MKPLLFTSCLAANADFIGEALASYVAQEFQIPTQFIGDISTKERENLFEAGEIQVCWMCGLQYVRKIEQKLPLELLAAPVMQESRYQNRPIYFSDIVVHAQSSIQNFEELEGVSWAYNEPGSHSGCYLVRSHLASLGKNAEFFGKIVQSGGHQLSLQMILNQQITASALDSTVLDLELKNFPEFRSQIRIIETIGPSPIPPWVIWKNVSLELKKALQTLFFEMDETPQGQEILAEGLMRRFDPIKDQDYHPIRQMAQEAENVPWPVA